MDSGGIYIYKCYPKSAISEYPEKCTLNGDMWMAQTADTYMRIFFTLNCRELKHIFKFIYSIWVSVWTILKTCKTKDKEVEIMKLFVGFPALPLSLKKNRKTHCTMSTVSNKIKQFKVILQFYYLIYRVVMISFGNLSSRRVFAYRGNFSTG